MINHKIEQGIYDWFLIKWGKVGGTRAKGLFTKSDDLLIELLSEYTEEFELEMGYVSPDMQRGKDLEPLALEKLGEYTGYKFLKTGWLQCEENPLLGISCDGITEDETVSAETKCFARKNHIKTVFYDEIPLENIHQSIHYFTVNPKLEKHYFCAFRPESLKTLFVKELTRETLVDIGLKKKIKVKSNKNGKGEKEYVETVPDIRTVDEWVKLAKSEAKELEDRLEIEIEKIKF